MTHVLAAEGGYQEFTLAGGEWFWSSSSPAPTALLAIAVGFFAHARRARRRPGHAEDAARSPTAIQEGAIGLPQAPVPTIGFILIPLAVVVFLTSTAGRSSPTATRRRCRFGQSGIVPHAGLRRRLRHVGPHRLHRHDASPRGATCAPRPRPRPARCPAALKVAFRTGGVAGMFTVGLGLLGATVIIMIFQNTASAILIGFGFGGSLLALFLRVGGGIFTKAADVGADLVGKVEAGIPEDDPRNPATIADNVGDNVGDCAGMAADLFESYEVTLVASIILGVAAFQLDRPRHPVALGLIFPLAARAIGVLASIVGVFAVRADRQGQVGHGADQPGLPHRRHPHRRRHRRRRPRSTSATTRARSPTPGWRVFGAVVVGLVLAQVVSRLTEYFTSTETRAGPGDRRGGPHRPGHHRARPASASGLESSVYAIIAIAVATRRRHRARRRQHPVLALPRRPHRHGHARHHRRRRVRGHVRPGGRQRRRHRRDVGRVRAASPSGSW